MQERPSIIFAGGGSGGHISPGLAIAERVAEIDPQAQRLFICSERPIDREMLEEANEQFVTIPATPPILRPRALVKFLRNFRHSRACVRQMIEQRPITHVIALGGFIAVPVAAAGRDCGIPVTLVNLDSPPGKANRWMRRWCDHVFSAVDLHDSPRFADEVVGLPIRKRAIAPDDASHCRAQLRLEPTLPTLLVTGASQGATSINELMIELLRTKRDLFDGWQVLLLSGREADEPLRAAMREANVRGRVDAFVHEMGLAWGAADLALSRAGANSVAEIAANAVPTIFLPYPWHRDMHQKRNAAPLADAGGAVIVDDQVDAAANIALIEPVLRELMSRPEKRQSMRERLRSLPRTDAAERIARFVLSR